MVSDSLAVGAYTYMFRDLTSKVTSEAKISEIYTYVECSNKSNCGAVCCIFSTYNHFMDTFELLFNYITQKVFN